ncbi:MAG: hypothetical protein ACYDBY_02415 [Thermoanaerobaculia bacterium]
MPRPSPLPEKARWLVLVAGLTASIPLYAVVVFVLATTGAPASAAAPIGFRYAVYGAAFGAALLALVLAPRVGADAATSPAYPEFLRRTLVSLAVAEVSAILGLVLFMLGRNLGDFLVLAGLALAVILLGIVPRGLRWFRLHEEPGSGGAPPLGPA